MLDNRENFIKTINYFQNNIQKLQKTQILMILKFKNYHGYNFHIIKILIYVNITRIWIPYNNKK